MPRKTKKEALAARQQEAAPFLFDEKAIPVRSDVLKAVQDRRYAHTGARLLEDEQLALRLVEKLTLGVGIKKISAELHISPHTIRAARRELERQGKLAPYKERVGSIFADIIEAGAQEYRDAIEAGLVKPAMIPVGVGIFSDKKALLDGTPTAIVAQVEDKEAIMGKLNGFLAKLQPVIDLPKPTAIEAQSTVCAANPEENRTS